MHTTHAMKESMIGVLMYLLRNHMKHRCQLNHTPKNLTDELQRAGFQEGAINKAFNWLAELKLMQFNIQQAPPAPDSIRILSHDERRKIDVKFIGFIMHLEQIGVLNPETRELTIAQIMQLDHARVTLQQVQWVILIVLFNHPNQHDALMAMENLVLNNNNNTKH